MKKKIIVALICLFIIGGGATGFSILTQNNSDDTTSDTTDTDNQNSDDEEEEETDTTEESVDADDLDDDDSSIERTTNKAEELFNICLKYSNDYDEDLDDFKIVKAMKVEDLTCDYVYIAYKIADGKTTYICYDYDTDSFRDDSSSTLKDEYDQCLIDADFDEDDYNLYDEFSKDIINEVNDMF